MGKKSHGNKEKQKLTKKELKAINHQKLMESRKSKMPGTADVIQLNDYRQEKDKKKAA